MNALIVREGIDPENIWNFDEKASDLGIRTGCSLLVAVDVPPSIDSDVQRAIGIL